MSTDLNEVKQETKAYALQFIQLNQQQMQKQRVNFLKPERIFPVTKYIQNAVSELVEFNSNILSIRNLLKGETKNVLMGSDEQKAFIMFSKICDNIMQNGSEISWGRIVALCAFCSCLVQLLIDENKEEHIHRVGIWLGDCLAPYSTWICQQGNGIGWEELRYYSPSSKENIFNNIANIAFIIFATLLMMMYIF